jgi:hypothetical protein
LAPSSPDEHSPNKKIPVVYSARFSAIRLLPGLIGQQVARLAPKRRAQGVERREADGTGLAGLEHREIGQCDPDLLGEIGQRHAPLIEQVVELDGHAITQSPQFRRAWLRLARTAAPVRRATAS